MAERTQIDHAAAYHYEPKRMEDVNMLKTLAKEIRQYKKATVLAPVFTGFEVLMEILIPFVTASIIDQGIEAGNMQKVYLEWTRTYSPPAVWFPPFPRHRQSAYVQYASFRVLEKTETRPTGGQRVRQRLLRRPARRLNDAYWTYAE